MKNNEISLKCICCSKPLEYLGNGEYEANIMDMWNNAGIHLFVSGYDSKHDINDIIIGICDNCLDVKIKDKVIIVKQTLEDKLGEGLL